MTMFDSITDFFSRGAETIDTVASGDIVSAAQGFNWTPILFWARIFFWFVVLLGGGVLIYHFFFKYNKKILVKKLKGDAVVDSYFDRGKIRKDERGKTKLVLLKTRKTCPVPNYTYTSKMGKLDFYELYLDEMGELHPIKDTGLITSLEGEKHGDKMVDLQVMNAWRLDELKLMEERFKKKGFLMEHLPEIVIFITAIVCLGMIWITMKSVETAGVAHAQAIKELAQSLANLR